jgi:hypothetical protein
MAEDAPRVVDVLVAAGAIGAASVVSDLPPGLGGSAVLGAGVAPSVGGVSANARFSSSLAARGGVARVAVEAGSGPDMVWLIFFFFFFFLRGKEVRRKVSQD